MSKAALIHLLTEFAPVIVFFVAGQLLTFKDATVILIVVTLAAFGVSWLYERRIPFLPLVSGAFVLVFGIATYLYDQPDALIVADTIYYFLLAALIGGSLLLGRNFLKWVFAPTFAMDDTGWYIISTRWALVFCLAGIANETVRILMTPEFWIDYRFAKVLLITAFGVYQFRVAAKHRLPHLANKWGLRRYKLGQEPISEAAEAPSSKNQ